MILNLHSLIDFKEAYQTVMAHARPLGIEKIALEESAGRILAAPILADRPLPPYDRATMDGIALSTQAWQAGQRDFKVVAMARAGMPATMLQDRLTCIEIATGAVLPAGCDAVVRYEDLEKISAGFRAPLRPEPGQNIHAKGSDAAQGSKLLGPGTRLTAAEVAVLASVGVSQVPVYRLPKVTVISTGDELIGVDQVPEAHQIRKSNSYALQAALAEFGIRPSLLHLPDDEQEVRKGLQHALKKSDALLLTGGVSMGKYDLLPKALGALGVTTCFHKVSQRPGKPFWFGVFEPNACTVFSLPGNPVSTFLNYMVYFRDWLKTSWGMVPDTPVAVLGENLDSPGTLTRFVPVRLEAQGGKHLAWPVPMNGSGDFLSLSRADAFLRLDPGENRYASGTQLPLVPFKPLWV